jgi:hypothetical protein
MELTGPSAIKPGRWSDPGPMSSTKLLLNGVAACADPVYLPEADPSKGSDIVKPGVTHYSGFVPVSALTAGLPNTPNLRDANLKSAVSKDVKESLLANDGEFHLKNKGITLLASSVEKVSGGGYLVRVGADRGDGILDGGHTYKIIRKAIDAGEALDKQYVFISVRVNVPEALRDKMAEGLNKTTAVSASSIANRMGEFDWIKDRLDPATASQVIWRQNDAGRVKIDELIAEIYAVHPKVADPHVAYSSRARALAGLRNPEYSFKNCWPLLPDVFKLYERIQVTFGPWAVGALGSRSIEASSTRTALPALFDTGLPSGKPRLTRAVALPVLSAFGAAVRSVQDLYIFDREYPDMCALLDACREPLQSAIVAAWNKPEVSGDPGTFGKRSATWSSLRAVVEQTLRSLPAAAPREVTVAGDAAGSAGEPAWDLRVEEVIEMWRDDMAEVAEDVERVRGALSRADTSEIEDLRRVLMVKESSLQQFLAAINHAESGLLGSCSKCGGPVHEGRVLEPGQACHCVSCA